MSLSPASIRNVMHDLEALGLIFAPHTSAGRLPTELGLRFFVDSMLQIGDLPEEERARIEDQVSAPGSGDSLEKILSGASSMLSGLTRSAGVVVTNKDDQRLRQMEFVRIEAERALAVLVAEDGSVENRVFVIPGDLPQSALSAASAYLNAHMRGRRLQDVKKDLEDHQRTVQGELDALTARVIEAGVARWTPGEAPRRQLIVCGQANLLGEVSAWEDLERIRLLFDDLETKKDVIDLLSRAETGEGVRIYIGSENKLFSLSGSTLVAAPIRDQHKRVLGVLGVIGPTRLNYARVIPMVDYTAKLVAKTLGG